jgi:hypothetical protein
MEELEKIKRDITACLEQIGLDKEISLEEVENEIVETDTAFQSLILENVRMFCIRFICIREAI